MNAHALAGLAALNLWLYITGVAVLFAIRGWNRWSGLARLSGLAYLLGVATSGVVWIFELVVGIPFGIVAIVVTGLVIGAVGVAVGLRLGRRLPPRPSRPTRLPAVSPVVAVSVALVVVYLEALFRVARLDGLYEFDAWDFWIPKAKAIYYFGGLDPQFFREVINQSYPPLVPTLEAAAFHFMGAADVVTLHVQFWLLFVGFVAAIAGLLSPRVSPFFLWPPLLLLVVAPYVIGHATQTTADFALDELIAASVLLVALWLIDRAQWQLSAATVLLAGAMSTKREGYLFGASIVVSALVVTWPTRRTAWPRLVVAGVVAVAATIPWRVLLITRDLGAGGPEAGGTGLLSNSDRAWPSLRLAVTTLFDYDIWLIAAPVIVAAVVAAILAGSRLLPGYAALLCVLAVAGFTWATWAFPSLGISTNPALNPIVRLIGFVTMFMPALVPLLLLDAWGSRGAERQSV